MINTEIKIDEDNNVIRFKSQHQNRTACQHSHVIVSESTLEITCKQCGAKVNPVWWIIQKMDQINSAQKRYVQAASEADAIWQKLDAKRKYCCVHCHEVNTIDFKKLVSKAAVERGLKVVDERLEGLGVEKL